LWTLPAHADWVAGQPMLVNIYLIWLPELLFL
ncbi:uncharacterized protein METZ01_LOCUS161177, partial [marine metagenome]